MDPGSGRRTRRTGSKPVSMPEACTRTDSGVELGMALGAYVGDMDSGTPGLQYVDQTGDIGDAWYYRVAAYNAAWGLEGPL